MVPEVVDRGRLDAVELLAADRHRAPPEPLDAVLTPEVQGQDQWSEDCAALYILEQLALMEPEELTQAEREMVLDARMAVCLGDPRGGFEQFQISWEWPNGRDARTSPGQWEWPNRQQALDSWIRGVYYPNGQRAYSFDRRWLYPNGEPLTHWGDWLGPDGTEHQTRRAFLRWVCQGAAGRKACHEARFELRAPREAIQRVTLMRLAWQTWQRESGDSKTTWHGPKKQP